MLRLQKHLLTERLLSTAFDNRPFTWRNLLASEIENVSDTLGSWLARESKFYDDDVQL